MNQKIFQLFTFFLLSVTLSAQSLSKGPYKVTVSNVKEEKSQLRSFGKLQTTTALVGEYRLEKNGTLVRREKFVFRRSKEFMSLLIMHLSPDRKVSLDYDPKMKLFFMDWDQYKPLKTDTEKNVVMSGILILNEISENQK